MRLSPISTPPDLSKKLGYTRATLLVGKWPEDAVPLEKLC